MFRHFALITVLVCLGLIASVACNGENLSKDDDSKGASSQSDVSPVATASAASGKGVTAVEATKAALGLPKGKTREETRVDVDLSEEGDTFDFTIAVIDGSGYQTNNAFRDRFEPNTLTFKVGQTVNLTLQPDNPKSTLKHTFTAPSLGINQAVKYGKPASFTFTFDTAGVYQVFCTVKNQMVGKITVIQ